MMTIKQLLTTELRVDLLDLIPDFCFEEIICGPPTIITPSFRSELFIIKADAFHNVRQTLDWVTFQHITMIIIRDYMDFTLSPALQGIYGKLVLNFIDACQKAENGTFPQLVIGYSYDSARMLYSNLFFSLTHRLDVVTQECTKNLLSSGSKSDLAPKINEFYDSDEEDSGGQEWMKDENAKVELENIDEPMDEFEREEPYDPEKGHSFVSIAMESFARKRTKKLKEKINEVLKNGSFQETNKKREAHAERIEKMYEKSEAKMSKHSFKTKDSRTQMVWFNRPLARNLEVLPLIKSHSEIPPEKCNTFIPPEPFPYSIQEIRNIYKHYTGALRQLFIMVHFDDDLKSSNPPMDYFIALNKLFRNFIDVFELCNFSPSPNPPFVAPHNQAINSTEDKEMFEYFTVIFSSIHPAVYERILKHHLPYFMHRSTVSFSIQQLLLHILSTPLVIPTNMILFDYICENMDILFLYDDDDKHRVDFFSKLIRLILTHVMQNLRTEPLLKDYISKIQAFFYKLITKTVHYIVRMYDASHLQAMLKTILRICGSPQAEQFYKLFLPIITRIFY
uniref:Uncharacterized protein n=1 Tax=Panagrolaimus davidi TaxID=227884 RepID=A0A914QS05_9BILA